MARNSTLFILFIVITTCAQAQGYRGQRFVFMYQPSLATTSVLNLPKTYTYHRLSAGYVLSDHLLFNVHGQFGAKKYSTDLSVFIDEGAIKDISGGVELLFFRKINQCYAPLGKFIGFGFEYGRQNSVREIPDPTTIYYNLLIYDDQNRVPLYVISAVLGRNYMIGKHFLLGLGVQYSYCLGDPHVGSLKYRQAVKPFINLGITL